MQKSWGERNLVVVCGYETRSAPLAYRIRLAKYLWCRFGVRFVCVRVQHKIANQKWWYPVPIIELFCNFFALSIIIAVILGVFPTIH